MHRHQRRRHRHQRRKYQRRKHKRRKARSRNYLRIARIFQPRCLHYQLGQRDQVKYNCSFLYFIILFLVCVKFTLTYFGQFMLSTIKATYFPQIRQHLFQQFQAYSQYLLKFFPLHLASQLEFTSLSHQYQPFP